LAPASPPPVAVVACNTREPLDALRRRGAVATRAVALVNVLGRAARYGLRGPLARLRPDRWGAESDAFRAWAQLHRIGLRPRARLERRARP
jgi:hypothetical protein